MTKSQEPASRTLILSPERVRRTLTRLAYEVVERNRGAATLDVVGILDSGRPLAEALAEEIGAVEGHALPAHALDTQPYRDDRTERAAGENRSRIEADLDGRDVILVDDVLFTGRTARAALDAVIQFGRPHSIQFVALIDRGHREYPIQPDYVGRRLQTKHRERVFVDAEGDFAVYVTE